MGSFLCGAGHGCLRGSDISFHLRSDHAEPHFEAAEKRADLDLQISLLAEHEVTKIAELVAAIAERMGVESARSSEIDQIKQDVAPEVVLDEIEATSKSDNREREVS
jgi:uncharacterized membrane protein